MSYKKRAISNAQQKLESRIAALQPIDPDFDFGQGLDKATLVAFVDSLESKRETYNNTLAAADTLRDELTTLNNKADDISERLYAAIIAKYGRDSAQYQQIGGTRKSEITRTGSRPDTFQGKPSSNGAANNTGQETGTP